MYTRFRRPLRALVTLTSAVSISAVSARASTAPAPPRPSESSYAAAAPVAFDAGAPARADSPVPSGKNAVRALLASFRAARVELDERGTISPALIISAGAATADIYDYIFGREALLSKFLRRTTERHIRLIEVPLHDANTPAEARACVFELSRWELRERGLAFARSRKSISHAVLWLGRGLSFIRLFMEIFAKEADVKPHVAARRAYDAELGIFHAYVIKSISRVALRYAPQDRQTLYVQFGYLRADGTATDAFLNERSGGRATFADVDALVAHELSQCSTVMLPVLGAISSFLASNDLDPSERLGTLFSS